MTRRLRIMHLVSKIVLGGAEIFVLNLLPRFNARYESVLCIFQTIEGGRLLQELVSKIGCKVISINARQHLDVRGLACLNSIIRRERPDILHTHTPHSGAFARMLAKLAGVRSVISTQYNIASSFTFAVRLLDRLTFVFADKIVCDSQAVEESFFGVSRREYCSDRSGVRKGITIYTGVDVGEIEQKAGSTDVEGVRSGLGLGGNDFLITTVGRLIPQKGHKYFIEAAERVLELWPNAKFIIVGYGRLYEELYRQIDSLGLSGKVLLAGKRDDVVEVLAASDLFVLPSLWEGFSVVLLQAMGTARPIVATRVAGITEAITDGVSGVLVPARNSSALAEGIIRVIGDSELRARICQAAREEVRRRFTIDLVAREYEALYEYMAGRS